jgi:SagB-type dehydrogenase family enzyme
VLFYDGGRLICENYLTGQRASVPSGFPDLLRNCANAASRGELIKGWGFGHGGETIFQALLEHDLLLEVGSPLETRDALVDRTWAWDIEAKYFYFGTALTTFGANNEEVWSHLDEKACTDPPPSPYKRCAGEEKLLPQPEALPISLGQALTLRRTCREFDGSITLQNLSSILWWTWGRQREIRGGSIGDVLLKTSPSGGARHPVEVYVVCQNVTGLSVGIYHYNVERHGLTKIKAGGQQAAVEGCFRQEWVEKAAASFIMTAILSRTMWKYQQSHALRVVLMEVGHLGQTLHLVTTALGLGPFTTAALNVQLLESTLGIDGVSEVPLYMGSVGPRVEVHQPATVSRALSD